MRNPREAAISIVEQSAKDARQVHDNFKNRHMDARGHRKYYYAGGFTIGQWLARLAVAVQENDAALAWLKSL